MHTKGKPPAAANSTGNRGVERPVNFKEGVLLNS